MNKTLFGSSKTAIVEKMQESLRSTLPIILIVAVLCLTIAPLQPDLLLSFLIGSVLIIVGMGLFSLGAEISMTPIGNKIGTSLTRTRNLPLILGVSFLLGFAVTVAEPDLQVLAKTVPHIDTTVLLIAVGAGVGFFLSVCMLRILTGFRLRWLLLAFYGIVFALAAFTDADFLSIAFDSGGVTTGPMTVPFILALGLGVSNARSDDQAESDSFGLVALSSIGPILAVLILGFFYSGSDASPALDSVVYTSTTDIGLAYLRGIPLYLGEMALALAPIVVIFLLFQIIRLRLSKHSLAKILTGIVYTYLGLVLFLTGANVGFSALGAVLGAGTCRRLDEVADGAALRAAGLVHHLCRAGRGRAGKADRRGQRGRDPRKGHQAQSFRHHRRGHGAVHAARADGTAASVLPRPRLCPRAGAVLLCPGHLYRHRL